MISLLFGDFLPLALVAEHNDLLDHLESCLLKRSYNQYSRPREGLISALVLALLFNLSLLDTLTCQLVSLSRLIITLIISLARFSLALHLLCKVEHGVESNLILRVLLSLDGHVV